MYNPNQLTPFKLTDMNTAISLTDSQIKRKVQAASKAWLKSKGYTDVTIHCIRGIFHATNACKYMMSAQYILEQATEYKFIFMSAGMARLPKAEPTSNDFAAIWNAEKLKMQANGSIFYGLEKTNNGYKDGIVTYQNRLCQWWTAHIIKGQLTDVMIKADTQEQARANQIRWEQNL